MEQEPPFRLVRDALGFYTQVPITEELVAEDAVEAAVVVPAEVTLKPRRGRPKLNAEFEVPV